jgi:S-adenosylmethionine hydrolase
LKEKPNLATLTTDFGNSQGHVGIMKGVMLSINPKLVFIDISNEVPAHDVFHCAFVLGTAFKYFPRGTVHVAVVDPGVGSAGRSIIVLTDRHFFVGPDNGLFTFVYRESEHRVWELTKKEYTLKGPFTTFDARDVYAPVASYLSLGVSLDEMGFEIDDPVTLPLQEPIYGENELKGEVIHIDQFGNLITNIEMKSAFEELRSVHVKIRMGEREIGGPLKSYSEGRPGEPFCLWGSHGFLEVAINGGRAADTLPEARRGAGIFIQYGE